MGASEKNTPRNPAANEIRWPFPKQYMLTLEWLSALWEEHLGAAQTSPECFTVGEPSLALGGAPRIMGVVNLSPQSWYRESVCLSPQAAIQRGKVLAAQGAHLIDIGGESTLEYADRASDTEQIKSIVPIVMAFTADGLNVSVETYSAKVAHAALKAGATVINMTGTEDDETIYALAAEHDAAVIISYLQGKNARAVGDLEFAGDPFDDLRVYFEKHIQAASNQSLQKLILDPGMGFYYQNLQDGALRVRYQMETLLQTFRLGALGFPVCHALPHAFEFFREEVQTAEPFFAVLAALGKTNLFRTHEVSRVKAVLDTLACFDLK
ncbi:MAG: Dihydropteroate synthase [Verrucomicrobia subdivision 3 bacterium]|nr:Dihydropteroate synthase [Limisphaerales bacterium]MCS1417264.1 Dihydropteroate synthase [Limisphaerales bacterium]